MEFLPFQDSTNTLLGGGPRSSAVPPPLHCRAPADYDLLKRGTDIMDALETTDKFEWDAMDTDFTESDLNIETAAYLQNDETLVTFDEPSFMKPAFDEPLTPDYEVQDQKEDDDLSTEPRSVESNIGDQSYAIYTPSDTSDIKEDSESTKPALDLKPALPWKITSFWVSPDVKLKECSVRLKKLSLPLDSMDIQSVCVSDEEAVTETTNTTEDEGEEVDEWEVLQVKTEKADSDGSHCLTDDAAGAMETYECLTKLLLKKCRHRSSSSVEHDKDEKNVMLSAYDDDKDSDNESNHSHHSHYDDQDIIDNDSATDTQPNDTTESQRQSFSSLLEQCLRRNVLRKKRVKRFFCDLCGEGLCDIDELASHIRHHPRLQTLSRPIIPSGYRCPLCWAKFPSQPLLVGHMLHICQSSPPPQKSSLSLVQGTDVYFCEKCLQGFPNLKVAAGHATFTCRKIRTDKAHEDKVGISQLFSTFPASCSKNRLLRVEEFRCPTCWARFPSRLIAEGHLKHTCVFKMLDILI